MESDPWGHQPLNSWTAFWLVAESWLQMIERVTQMCWKGAGHFCTIWPVFGGVIFLWMQKGGGKPKVVSLNYTNRGWIYISSTNPSVYHRKDSTQTTFVQLDIPNCQISDMFTPVFNFLVKFVSAWLFIRNTLSKLKNINISRSSFAVCTTHKN